MSVKHLIAIEKAEVELSVECKVTDYTVVAGDPFTWDSDWDYHGYTDLAFDVVSVVSYNYETEESTKVSEDVLSEKDFKYIEEKLLDILSK